MPANNNLFQRNANISLIAQLIWRRNGISRVDISRQLKLNKSTVSNIISVLLNAGLVNEGERGDSCSQGGRKPIELTINRSFGCVFGFDIQPGHYRSVIMSVDGSVLWQQRGERKKGSFEDFVLSVIDEAFESHSSLGIPVLALSFSLPGEIDSRSGMIIHSYPFRIDNYDFKGFLKSHYNYPVYIDNDANASAWFDLHENLGAAFSSSALSVIADFHEEARENGTVAAIGIGMGVIIEGKVYRGSHNSAGEFRSISWNNGDDEQSGLELELLQKTLSDSRALTLWLLDIFHSLIPVCSVMDFQKVILHGNPFKNEEWVRETLEKEIPAFLGILKRTRCELVFNSEDEAVSAKGAALMYLHDLYSIPELEGENSDKWSWDDVIDFSLKQRGGKEK